MRVSIILPVICLSFFNVYSQYGVVTRYYSKNDQEVSKENSIYYQQNKERMVSGDTIKTFYTSNDKLRSVAVVNEHNSPTGPFSNYHENGRLKSSGFRKNNWPSGTITSYYPDGKMQSQETFFVPDEGTMLSTSVLINYYDSAGNQLIKGGNGKCICHFAAFEWESFAETGKLVEGKKDSIWTGFDSTLKRSFVEQYQAGVLQSGESFDSLGSSAKYFKIRVVPEYRGGLKALYKGISKNVKYPRDARRNNIEGIVLIGFIVNKYGSLEDIALLQGIGESCDLEAMRVMRLLNNWIPGKVRGVPVNVKFVLPIKFKLH